jgi:hypothetical protein
MACNLFRVIVFFFFSTEVRRLERKLLKRNDRRFPAALSYPLVVLATFDRTSPDRFVLGLS